MPNIDVIHDEPYLEPGTVRIAVHNTVHQSNFWNHTHRFFEFVYVSDGFTLHSYNGKTSILTSGDLFVIHPGDVHGYIAAYNANIYNILFYMDELGDMANELGTLPFMAHHSSEDSGTLPSVRVSLNDRAELSELLDLMIKERRERRLGWELALKTMLARFLIMFSRMMTDGTAEDRRGYCGYIYNVLSYVEENYRSDIDSSVLARVSGLSADHLTRQFKSVMGMTPVEYVRRFRIAKAMDMLKTTDMSVSEIAEASGFSDISLFSRVFKQTVGTSPAVFRKG